VIEKLDKGLLDFGVLIDRTDLSEYVTMRLPACDVWGVLVRRDSPLARHESVSAELLRSAPLIVSRQSRRKGSQLCEWFGGDMGHLNIRAEYNLIYNATLLVRAGMGCAVTIDKLINTSDSDLCFRPLYPKLETRLDMAWKKHAVFSRPAQIFLEYMRRDSHADARYRRREGKRGFLRMNFGKIAKINRKGALFRHPGWEIF